MPLNPQPLHPATHPATHPASESHGFKEWSRHVGDSAPTASQAPVFQPLLPGIDVTHPLFKVAVVAFIGYTLGRIIHRHA